VRPATVAELGDYTAAVRELAAGRSTTFEGAELALHWLEDPVPVPVWMAAEGPRTQRLAGRIADGVILSNSLTPERMAAAREHIAAGAAEAGRRIEDLEIWCMANLVFAPTEAEGIDSILSVLAGTANHVYRFSLDGKGLPDEYRDRVAGLMGEYQSRHHAQPGAANPNNALVDKYGLRDFLAAQGTIAGPPERCVERIREVAAAGATNLIVSQFVSDQPAWMRTFASDVLPAFR
jgi:5,10-methylenetetrahydromethanopterin reductase